MDQEALSFDEVLKSSADFAALANYFCTLFKHNANEQVISHALRELTAQEALPPNVFALWLQFTYKCQSRTIVQSMLDTSIAIRRAAIRSFGKQISKPSWELALNEAGRLDGIYRLFSELSVEHVNLLVLHLSKAFAGSLLRTPERAQIAESILLHLSSLPNSSEHPDGRFVKSYLKFLPGCGFEFVCSYLETHPECIADPLNKDVIARTVAHHILDFQALILQDFTKPLSLWQKAVRDAVLQTSRSPVVMEDNNFVWTILQKLVTCDPSVLARWIHCINDRLIPKLFSKTSLTKSHLSSLRSLFKTTILLLEREQVQRGCNTDGLSTKQLSSELDCACGQRPRYDVIDKAMIRWYNRERRLSEWETTSELFLNIHSRRVKCEGHESFLQRLQARATRDKRAFHREMRLLPRCLRFEFLQLICKNPLDSGIDIESPNVFMGPRPKFSWTVDLLLTFTRSENLRLLQLIMANDPECQCLGQSNSLAIVLGQSFSFSFIPEVLLLYLMRGTSKVCDVAEGYIKKWKRKAQTGREPDDRTECARIAVECATASGEVDLHLDVSQWCRRFLRDQTAWPILYNSTNGLVSSEVARILSPVAFENDSRPARFWTEQAQIANAVLRFHSESILLALEEPHLRNHSWGHWRAFCENVISQRFYALNNLAAQLPKDAIDRIMSISIDCIIEIEKSFVDRLESCKRFFYAPGIYVGQKQFPNGPSPEFLPFFDRLAYQRNEYWGKARVLKDEGVASLPEGFPQGLAVQHLLPFSCLMSNQSRLKMPYMKDRLDRTLWREELHPKDEEMKRLVGIFEDDWQWSLKVRINHGTEEQRKKVVDGLWDHKSSLAVSGVVDIDERWTKLLKLKHRFRLALGARSDLWPFLDVDYEPLPHFPASATQDETPMEWFPVRGSVETCSGHFELLRGNPYISSYWNPNLQVGFKSREICDAFILSIMLFLDNKSGSKSQLLTGPYPSKNNTRFPHLFLDSEFVDRVPTDESHIMNNLTLFIQALPLKLVVRLTNRVVDDLNNATSAAQRSSCMDSMISLTKILADCDDPSLAFPFVKDILLSKPDWSTYHRHVLQETKLKRIMAKDVRDLLTTLCKEAIRLNAVSVEMDSTKSSGSETVPSQPQIKVTTFKHLATCAVGDHINSSDSLLMLTDIMQSQKHPHILEAVLRSIMRLMKKSIHDGTMVENIFRTLETLIPRVDDSSQVQRNVSTIAAEMQVEESSSTFTLDQMQTPTTPLTTHIWSLGAAVPSEHQESFVHRILLPFIDVCSKEHDKWIRSFVRKHGDNKELSLGLIFRPFENLWALQLISDWGWAVPIRYLQLLQPTRHQFSASDRQAVQTTSMNVEKNVQLRNSKEGSHWMQICDFDWIHFADRLLYPVWKDARPYAVKITDIQELVYQQACEFRQSNRVKLISLMNHVLLPNLSAAEHRLRTWSDQIQPVTTRAVHLLESTWIPPKENVAISMPHNFEQLFEWKTYLLSFPQLPQMMHRADRYSVFSDELCRLLEEMMVRSPTYHEDFFIIKRAALNASRHPGTAEIVLKLGDVSPISTVGLLRIEIAAMVLDKLVSPAPTHEVRIRVREMVEAWSQSKVEKVWRFCEIANDRMRCNDWFPSEEN